MGIDTTHPLLRLRAHDGRMEDFKSWSTGRAWVKLFWIWGTTVLMNSWWQYLSAQDLHKNRQVNIAAWRWGSGTATLNWGVIDSWWRLERDRQFSLRVWSLVDPHTNAYEDSTRWTQCCCFKRMWNGEKGSWMWENLGVGGRCNQNTLETCKILKYFIFIKYPKMCEGSVSETEHITTILGKKIKKQTKFRIIIAYCPAKICMPKKTLCKTSKVSLG